MKTKVTFINALFLVSIAFSAEINRITQPKLVLTEADVYPDSVRIFGLDESTNLLLKPVGKSSEETKAMQNRPTEIVAKGVVVARSPHGGGGWTENGTNCGLVLVFDSRAEAKVAAAALRDRPSK